MKAKTQTPVDQRSFEKMKRILPNLSQGRKNSKSQKPPQAMALPEEVAFKLTNRCNLRCHHCYQWGEKGHHMALSHEQKNQDLDLAIIEKSLAQTRDAKSNLYFWGGEPLLYKNWRELIELLKDDPRYTSICTNGIGLDERIGEFAEISEKIEFLIALDGFEAEHDTLRGPGAFAKTMKSIDALIRARQSGKFFGEVSVNFVISEKMAGRIYEFSKFLEQKEIDALYISLPWYVSPEKSKLMDQYIEKKFRESSLAFNPKTKSWNSYQFHLKPGFSEELLSQFERVNERAWKIKVCYNPALEPEEIREFIYGTIERPKNRSKCMALQSRMDIMPDGEVVSCKFFPEFSVGNLHQSSVSALWHGDAMNSIREAIDSELMPLCTSCNLLYSRGI